MPRTRNITRNNTSTQDIMETEERIPTPRPRRRAKAPIGELGRKLKQKALEASSLPPSSPVPASPSSYPYSLPVASSEDALPPPSKWWQEEPDNAKADLNPEYYEEEEATHLPPSPQYTHPARGSDPFGFFAVEKMLKEERLKQPAKPKPKSRPPPPPSIDTQPLKAPRTPHKQRIGKRPTTTSSNLSSANPLDDQMSSQLSSPSPMKPPTKRSVVKESSAESVLVNEDEGGGELEEETEKEQESLPQGKRSRRKKARVTGSSDDPIKDLRALRPRRPGAATRNRRKRTDENSDASETESKKRPIRKKGKGRAAKKPAVGEMVVDDEEWTAERKARLEYFKKLDKYQVHKENVYVI